MKDKNRNTKYGPNNPEPTQFKASAINNETDSNDALHAAREYLSSGDSSDEETEKKDMPCKNSLPT